MAEYVPTIGLEIHAELRTKTKMFCCSKNDADETRPNVNICPVCLAHPGTLPVINKEAVRHVLRVGIALKAQLADYTEFDRKNYFYPDLPKGYQISQFEFPLVSKGMLNGVAITRVHLEEDTASSIHDDNSGETLIDYNRSGVPLMELVTEPDMHSSKQAGDFARELQLLLRYLGASGANMEKGEMRVEANVSVARAGERSSAYVEIKNLNSFRTMEKAIEYEIKRQTEMIERGETLQKQTLGWDEMRQQTFPQRLKEGSADYRYFPDPDLPSLRLSDVAGFSPDSLKAGLPELPAERRARYEALGIKPEDAELYVRNVAVGDFFDGVASVIGANNEALRLASNYISNDLMNLIRDTDERDTEIQSNLPILPVNFTELISLLMDKKISSRSAKDILADMLTDSQSPTEIATKKALFLDTSREKIQTVISELLLQHAAVVEEYRKGKTSVVQFLVGQAMKEMKGGGDPQIIRESLLNRLSGL